MSWLLRYVSTHDSRGFAVDGVIAGALILVLVAPGVMRWNGLWEVQMCCSRRVA